MIPFPFEKVVKLKADRSLTCNLQYQTAPTFVVIDTHFFPTKKPHETPQICGVNFMPINEKKSFLSDTHVSEREDGM